MGEDQVWFSRLSQTLREVSMVGEWSARYTKLTRDERELEVGKEISRQPRAMLYTLGTYSCQKFALVDM